MVGINIGVGKIEFEEYFDQSSGLLVIHITGRPVLLNFKFGNLLHNILPKNCAIESNFQNIDLFCWGELVLSTQWLHIFRIVPPKIFCKISFSAISF